MQVKAHARVPAKECSTDSTLADAADDTWHGPRTEPRYRIGHNPHSAGRSTPHHHASDSRSFITTPNRVAPSKKTMPPPHSRVAYRFPYPCDL